MFQLCGSRTGGRSGARTTAVLMPPSNPAGGGTTSLPSPSSLRDFHLLESGLGARFRLSAFWLRQRVLALLILALAGSLSSIAQPVPAGYTVGTPWTGAAGVQERTADIMA